MHCSSGTTDWAGSCPSLTSDEIFGYKFSRLIASHSLRFPLPLLQSHHYPVSTSSDQLPAQPAPRPWPLAPEPEPLFGLPEVFFVFLAALLALLVCGELALVIAHHLPSLSRIRPAELAPVDPTNGPRVLLPAQLAAY